jgi:predicted transcriptional regulator
MTQNLKMAFQKVAELPGPEQDDLAGFVLDQLAFRAAVREGIEAADRGDVVPLEEVEKMIPTWAAK